MLSPYNVFELQDGDFIFTTDLEVVYTVYILSEQGYFSDYPEFTDDVYMFGFSILSNPTRKTPFDQRVRLTTSYIVKNFLAKNPEKILLFICDNADSRQIFRMKIFERWYQLLKVDFVEKYNESIVAPDIDIHCSIILHSYNSQKSFIISSFRCLSYTIAEKLKSY